MHEDHDTTTHLAPTLPTDRRALLAGIGGLAAGALLAGKAHAGPLSPPPGPIAPTPGPEPRIPINAQTTPGDANNLYRITQPGSYYLTGNIQTNLQTAIRIEARGVSVDLNGFALIGSSGQSAIVATSMAPGVRIRNGAIRNWNATGIRFEATGGISSLIEDIVIDTCFAFGIDASGPTKALRCVVDFCNQSGIRVGSSSTITDCSVTNLGGTGIIAGDGSVIERCLSANNFIRGVDAGFGCFVRHCLIRNNGSIGIIVRGGSTVEHCNVTLSSLEGIFIGGDGTARFNDCAANGRFNSLGGISCDSQDSRIEHNNCTNNGIGIRVTGSGNIILGNTCSGNLSSNYAIAAGNRYGPIIDLTAPTAPAASGNAAADTTGTTHPWANFAY